MECLSAQGMTKVKFHKSKQLLLFVFLQVKVVLVCVGISLSFGSLLMKTYRIFAIFQKAVAKFKQIVS